LSRADSITLDPHKGLFLPYGTGCLLVRDGAALKRAHHVVADYMPPMQDEPDLVDFSEISPELSRDFRGLRVWLPMKLHGIGVFREALDEKLDLANWATEELRKIDDIEIVAEPQLSIVAFRLRHTDLDEVALTELNKKLRVRTHMDRMAMCLEDIRESVGEVMAARG
jgi:aromatic-L-amino-acid decarboxylase